MKPLRMWRLERLLSVARLAKAAGVSNRTVLDIEHGKVRPKLRTIGRLSVALGVAPADVSEFAAVIRPGEAGENATSEWGPFELRRG